MNKTRTIFPYVITERIILKKIYTNLEKDVLFAQRKYYKVKKGKIKHILGHGSKGAILTKKGQNKRERWQSKYSGFIFPYKKISHKITEVNKNDNYINKKS